MRRLPFGIWYTALFSAATHHILMNTCLRSLVLMSAVQCWSVGFLCMMTGVLSSPHELKVPPCMNLGKLLNVNSFSPPPLWSGHPINQFTAIIKLIMGLKLSAELGPQKASTIGNNSVIEVLLDLSAQQGHHCFQFTLSWLAIRARRRAGKPGLVVFPCFS